MAHSVPLRFGPKHWALLSGLLLAAVPAVLFFQNSLTRSRAAAAHVAHLGKLTEIQTALSRYKAEHGHLPSPTPVGPDGETVHSWRVAILPYLSRNDIFRRYDLNEPWDSPSNLTLLREMPRVYSFSDGALMSEKTGVFAIVANDDSRDPGVHGERRSQLSAIIESAAVDAPWTKPIDLSLDDLVTLASSNRMYPLSHSGHQVAFLPLNDERRPYGIPLNASIDVIRDAIR